MKQALLLNNFFNENAAIIEGNSVLLVEFNDEKNTKVY
jgi:hypothetical protein